MKILCCGLFPALQRTLEFKTLKPGSVNRARSVQRSVGGKATNTARVLKTLGADPLLFGFAGGDTGTAIRRLLDEEGIEHAFAETAVPTRTAQTLLADDAHDFTELIEDSEPVASNDWKNLIQCFQALEKQCDAVIFSGTLPAHVPQNIYCELLKDTDNKTIIIDTPGAPLLAALKNRPALVKINAVELRETTGIENTEDAAQELIAQGAQAVGVTSGPDPALLITPETAHRVCVPCVSVVSTLGCGDAVNAGIVFALQKGSALPEAFAFGLACGTANAQTSLPGVIDPAAVASTASQITVQ